jgi:hypothetical protein
MNIDTRRYFIKVLNKGGSLMINLKEGIDFQGYLNSSKEEITLDISSGQFSSQY